MLIAKKVGQIGGFAAVSKKIERQGDLGAQLYIDRI